MLIATSAPESFAAAARSSMQLPHPVSSWRLSTTRAPIASSDCFTNCDTFQVMVCSGTPFTVVMPVVWHSLVPPRPSPTGRLMSWLWSEPW